MPDHCLTTAQQRAVICKTARLKLAGVFVENCCCRRLRRTLLHSQSLTALVGFCRYGTYAPEYLQPTASSWLRRCQHRSATSRVWNWQDRGASSQHWDDEHRRPADSWHKQRRHCFRAASHGLPGSAEEGGRLNETSGIVRSARQGMP